MIDVELNLGGPIVDGAGALLGNATIDFVESFPNANPNLDGYKVKTGTSTPDVYLTSPTSGSWRAFDTRA
jgi:hypothetical protein